MIDFESQCGEYLEYLYAIAKKYYSDCPDVDGLVQDTLTVFILKLNGGDAVEHPKGFLSAVMKNKYNALLREKYRSRIVEFTEGNLTANTEAETPELRREEYESVRREIGRLIRIYREVTVRHYVHGQSVEQISKELGIPRGTVLSRLSAARDQIKEGLEKMEKYSHVSYAPKQANVGIWGNAGLQGEPFTLVRSEIEMNVLIIAYENPVSVRGIADTMGMPSAYLEPIIDGLVAGELMGRTPGGLVYTRCFVQSYADSFGNIPEQESLAARYAARVWETAWRVLAPLTEREEFTKMSDKQKATLLLFIIREALGAVTVTVDPAKEDSEKSPPERPDAGRWLATLTYTEHGRRRDSKYAGSGPVHVACFKNDDRRFTCKMFDCQSLFGDSHWAYPRFKYKFSLTSILRFYASFLPCDVTVDNEHLPEMIPEFERLCILKRDGDGEIRLDIPALTFPEWLGHWEPACERLKAELFALLSEDLRDLQMRTRNRVPKHVDMAEHFTRAGSLGAYVLAQLLAIVDQKLLPYPVDVGKTPLILVTYQKRAD